MKKWPRLVTTVGGPLDNVSISTRNDYMYFQYYDRETGDIWRLRYEAIENIDLYMGGELLQKGGNWL